MAIIQGNSMVQGARGALGAVMYRKVGKRTILSAKPSSPKKQSELQRANRQKFKEASAYAKHILKDPMKKAYYLKKAKKLGLPNAYTAAVTDFMRKSEIKKVEAGRFKGNAGDVITMHVQKRDFAINNVRVVIVNEHNHTVAYGDAERKEPGVFIYRLNKSIIDRNPVLIRVLEGGIQSEVLKEIPVV